MPDDGTQPADLADSAVYAAFRTAPYRSGKYTSYFHAYDSLFERYRGQPITFVEVGVLNGGSLFMWRDYLGPAARIIGVEFNPVAKRWEQDGFEIHIGDQSDPAFWTRFYAAVGPIDVLLDDGGHGNAQQVVTAAAAVANVRDGGMVVVEDVHTSYWRRFGNPSRLSFISFAKRLIDAVNARSPSVTGAGRGRYGEAVASIEFFESMVALKVDRRRCAVPHAIDNAGATMDAENFFIHDQPGLRRVLAWLDARAPTSGVARKVISRAGDRVAWFAARRQARRGSRFFP